MLPDALSPSNLFSFTLYIPVILCHIIIPFTSYVVYALPFFSMQLCAGIFGAAGFFMSDWPHQPVECLLFYCKLFSLCSSKPVMAAEPPQACLSQRLSSSFLYSTAVAHHPAVTDLWRKKPFNGGLTQP